MRSSILTKFAGLFSVILFFCAQAGAVNEYPYLLTPKLDAGNVRVTGNILSTLNTNGDFTISPNGSGSTIFSTLSATTVPYLDASKKLTSSSVTPTQLGLLGTATSSNTASTLVQRDGSGNFSAGIVTAALTGNVTGNLTGAVTGNVTGNLTGNVAGTLTGAVLAPDGTSGAPSVSFANETNTGFYRAGAGDLVYMINGVQALEFLKVSSNINVGYGPSGTVSPTLNSPVSFNSSFNGPQYYTYTNTSTGSFSGTIFNIGNGPTANFTTIENWAYTLSGYLNGGSAIFASPNQTQMVIGCEYSLCYDAFTVGGRTLATERMRLTSTSLTLNKGTNLVLSGATSGALTINAGATGTYSITYPTANASGFGRNDGSGNLSWSALVGSDLPNPSASTLGGVESAAAVSHQWINSISTSGVPALSQPAFTDISGVATIANGGTNNGALGVDAGGIYYSDGSKIVNLAHGSSGTVLTSGGVGAPTWTAALTNPMDGAGQMIYGATAGAATKVAAGTSGQVPISAGTTVAFGTLPGNSTALKVPTIQSFTATGTQTGWLFTISTSMTVTVGETYTNNGNTYTVQGALTAQSGQVLFMSGTGATSGTSLVHSGAGSGTTPVTFSTKVATATYTTPTSPSPLYLVVKMVGGGGGGGTSGTAGGTAATDGTATFFGANLINAGPGLHGIFQANNPTVAATGSVSSPATTILNVNGASGSSGGENAVAGSAFQPGTPGASSCLGGAGGAAFASSTAATAAAANSGSGGAGGSPTSTGASNWTGQGGGAGACVHAMISGPAATYPYVIGAKGTGGGAGTNGGSGSNGGDGLIVVEEHYQ